LINACHKWLSGRELWPELPHNCGNVWNSGNNFPQKDEFFTSFADLIAVIGHTPGNFTLQFTALTLMNKDKLKILLADDDKDDCFLFREALSELPINAELKTVNDGEELMSHLDDNLDDLPDVIFLDLNMPRKNGFECLTDIKHIDELKEIPVIMFSTSYPRDAHYEHDIIKVLYSIGAKDYVRKPSTYPELKKVIYHTLQRVEEDISKDADVK
jgi:CheY-like chemotaxis protein